MADSNQELDTEYEVNIENDESNEEITETEETNETQDDATEGEDKDNKDESEEKETTDSDDKKDALPAFKSITAKYPKFFKDFPGLRTTYFREREFSKVFPSVEEAQEAAEANDTLNQFTSSITSGNITELAGTLKSISELGDEAIPNLAENFLPALRQADREQYFAAITPVMVDFVRALYDNGVRNNNENLKNAGLLAAIHFFEDEKVATGERKIAASKIEKKDNKVEEERRAFHNERYTTLFNDVVQDCNSQLMNTIKSGLDPKNSMTEDMKDMIAERVQKEIEKVLKSDNSYMGQINSLWKKAGTNNFSSSFKPKIVNTYLGRAKEIMPSIRAKIRSQVLGTRTRTIESNTNGNGGRTRRTEPDNTTGGGGQRQTNNLKNIDPKTVDWTKTTDLDYLNGRITLLK